MNTFIRIIDILFILCFIILFSSILSSKSIEPGQIWIKTLEKDDPWRRHVITNTVLEIRDNHVRYDMIYKGNTVESSESISIFRRGSKRIK
jgi:hypothetical protein